MAYSCDFPLYAAAFTSDTVVLCGGGGGVSKTGVANRAVFIDASALLPALAPRRRGSVDKRADKRSAPAKVNLPASGQSLEGKGKKGKKGKGKKRGKGGSEKGNAEGGEPPSSAAADPPGGPQVVRRTVLAEIELDDALSCVAVSPCGKYAALAYGSSVSIIALGKDGLPVSAESPPFAATVRGLETSSDGVVKRVAFAHIKNNGHDDTDNDKKKKSGDKKSDKKQKKQQQQQQQPSSTSSSSSSSSQGTLYLLAAGTGGRVTCHAVPSLSQVAAAGSDHLVSADDDGILDFDACPEQGLVCAVGWDRRVTLLRVDPSRGTVTRAAHLGTAEVGQLKGATFRGCRFVHSDEPGRWWEIATVASGAKMPAHASRFAIQRACGGKDESTWALDHVTSKRVHGEPLVSMAVSPDGSRIAFGSGEGHVILTSAGSLSVSSRSPRHSFFVPAVCFSRDGRIVASVSADATVKVALADTGNRRPGPVMMLIIAMLVLALAFGLQLHQSDSGNK